MLRSAGTALLLCILIQTSNAQHYSSLYGITENNFYYKSKDSFVKALSFRTQNGPPPKKGESSDASSDSMASAGSNKVPPKKMMMKVASGNTSTNKNQTTATGGSLPQGSGGVAGGAEAPNALLAFVGCGGLEFRFEIDHAGNVTDIFAILYVSSVVEEDRDMHIMYTWNPAFLDKVATSPYGETICLDDDKDYRFDVNGTNIHSGIQQFLAQVSVGFEKGPIVALESKSGDTMCSLSITNEAIDVNNTKCLA